MAKVFLSYARADSGKARLLALALEKAGHSVWWDSHVRGGAQFSKVIEEALEVADAVVVLWSKKSVESPWVRDEAAAGRDSDRLVPISLDETQPPLGFRQFQTVNLSGWRGRGKIPSLTEILSGVDNYTNPTSSNPVAPEMRGPQPTRRSRARWLIGAAAGFVLFLTAGFGLWKLNAPRIPVIEVVAADRSPRSAAAASELFIRLGSLAQVGDGKWQLVDSNSAKAKPDLMFRTSEISSSGRSGANLLLLDGKVDSLLWSREFNLPAGSDPDLRQQVALTAGRVLGCALESHNQVRLSADLFKTFLDACASLADQSGEDLGPATMQLRRIVDRVPQFEPAWSRLIGAESVDLEYSRFTSDLPQIKRQLLLDAAQARAYFPNLPELAVADVKLRDTIDYGGNIARLSAAIERAPDNPFLRSELSDAFLKVGRMSDAVSSARKAAELDPLSPGGTTTYIMTLAHSGEIETARNELKKVETLWAGTGSLRDVQLAFHVRYGDPAIAMKLDPRGYNTAVFYKTRADPSPQNIAKLKEGIDEFRPKSVTPDQVGWAIQALAQFGMVDDVFYWLGRLPDNQVADISYLLFRPALASVRRDPRFMPLAMRIGLISYWQKSGKWPDFCGRPGIPYDCKEATKSERRPT